MCVVLRQFLEECSKSETNPEKKEKARRKKWLGISPACVAVATSMETVATVDSWKKFEESASASASGAAAGLEEVVASRFFADGGRQQLKEQQQQQQRLQQS